MRRRLLTLTLLGILPVAGCRTVEKAGKVPLRTISILGPSKDSPRLDPGVLQAELQRRADDYLGRTVPALEGYARAVGTPEAGRQALRWKLSLASALMGIASGPNPVANLADLMVLATTSRRVLEHHVARATDGSAFQPWLDASRELEPEVWRLAEGVFTAAQLGELRDVVGRPSQVDVGKHFAFFERPREVSALVQQGAREGPAPESILALVGLDPTAGLEPAVREVMRSRLLAERAFYVTQRMPLILRWQAELLGENLLGNPALATALTNTTSLSRSADRLSRAAESVSDTAAQLPDRLVAERKALVAALEGQEEGLSRLLRDATPTLTAAERASASLTTTIATLDSLMQRLGVGTPPAPPRQEAPAEPFRITDYGQAASRLEAAAVRLNELLLTFDRMAGATNLARVTGQLSPMVQQVGDQGREIVDQAFRRGLLLLAGALAAALVYRLGVARWGRNADPGRQP